LSGYALDTTHTFTYTVAANGDCPGDNESVDIIIYSQPTAGTGSDLPAFCEGDNINGGSVDLTALLTGADPGGTWTDLDGAGVDLTNPTAVNFTGVTANLNPYRFKYTVAANGDCPASDTMVTVTVQDCIVDCGTAFGVFIDDAGTVDSGASRCFRQDGFSRWGWTNFISGFGTYTLELYQGAGKCDLGKGTFVGIVTVSYTQIGATDQGYVNVEYDMEPGYGIDEAHLYIGCELYPKHNGKKTVAPGQYTFVADGLGHIDKWSTETDEITVTGGFYIIAHAVACGEDIPEGSYIPGSPFEEGNFNGGVDPQCKVEVSDFGRVADFTAYPNPFENEINVKYLFEYETDVKIEVFDVKGTLVRASLDRNYVKGSVGRTTIDLSKADNQMYFVRLTTNEGTVVKKIVSSSSLDRQR
ncbi:T9SS type A sorting domain-containing protein, partial [Geojedonia litorea]